MSTHLLKTFGLRLALIPVLTLVALGAALAAPHSADAATVGDCATVTDLRVNGTGFGKIRWAGMSQCFAITLKGGYSYTITTEVGSPAEAYSSNIYGMLGDSVMELWSRKDGTFIQPTFDQSQFNLVAWNDDYSSTTLASRITFTAPGSFGEQHDYVIKVRGYGSAVGRYSVIASEYLVASPSPCTIYYC